MNTSLYNVTLNTGSEMVTVPTKNHLSVISKIPEGFQEYILGTFLDLSKAFDMIDNKTPPMKLIHHMMVLEDGVIASSTLNTMKLILI